MTYALIRHGETDWNRDGLLQGSSDIPLNATGRAQALAAADVLAGTPWTEIVSSPLGRARESAEIIARAIGLEPGPSYPGLAERDYGPWEGTSRAAARERWPDRDYPGAESLAAVAVRGRAALDRIADDFGPIDLVIVSHGTLIGMTLASLVGRALPSIDNGAVATLERIGDAWIVHTVNGIPLSRA